MGQSPAVHSFTAPAVSSPPENQISDVLLSRQTTCLQEVGMPQQQGSGVPKFPQSPTDSSLNQAVLVYGDKPGVSEGPGLLKLQLDELQKKLDKETHEKERLEQELKDTKQALHNGRKLEEQVCDLEKKLMDKTVEVDNLRDKVANLEGKIVKCKRETDEWRNRCLIQEQFMSQMMEKGMENNQNKDSSKS